MPANEALKELYIKGAQSLKILRRNAASPHSAKVLKEWGISETARMIGRTPQTLRNLEEKCKIPPARKKTNGKRIERVYSLQEINHLRDVFKLRPDKPKASSAVTVSIANFKGGVGKSCISLMLSQSLTLLGYKVLLVDSDSQGTSTHLGGGFIPDLHISPEQTLLNILIGESHDVTKCISKTHWDGLDLIPANLTLYNSEMIIPSQIYEHRQQTGQMLPFYARVSGALKAVKDQYDIILIDTPPSLGFITLNILYAVQGLIIPLLPSEVDYCSTVQFLNMAQETLSRLPKIDYHFIRLLISRHKPSSIQAKTMEAAIRQVFGSNVMTNYMIETEAIAKASSDMKTIYEVDPHPNDKRTFSRAIEHANNVAEEVQLLLSMVWNNSMASDVQQVNYDEAS